ncbi:ankyrin [Alcanivorax hongdengensis A-11-3]|uniref:Ankyrin n=1 Tax=Alcanivorax hongdengensis A-11-3 TaxID=1177179 RepID=L0WD16_9GAMM|nr:ankyrin repeat domain-containing protein [Alcanivorax hongdengensis]EKF73640.1 ankyrin [Alcanivorax hongdengensis A-11-3]
MENKEKNRSMLNAVRHGDIEKIKAILEEEPGYLHKMTPFGSWLHIAASAGQQMIAEYLIDQGIDININGGVSGGSPLNAAAQEGQREMVCFLIKNGALFDTSEPERNALFSAIYDGHTDIARILVEAGIDTSVKYTGQSMKNMGALEFAKERGHAETIAYMEMVAKLA